MGSCADARYEGDERGDVGVGGIGRRRRKGLERVSKTAKRVVSEPVSEDDEI